jgi:hypothetical protein
MNERPYGNRTPEELKSILAIAEQNIKDYPEWITAAKIGRAAVLEEIERRKVAK